MIILTQDDLKRIEQREVIGTERGTPIVELAEWERDALCGIARVVLGAARKLPKGSHPEDQWTP